LGVSKLGEESDGTLLQVVGKLGPFVDIATTIIAPLVGCSNIDNPKGLNLCLSNFNNRP
jgi:hypothetical protein